MPPSLPAASTTKNDYFNMMMRLAGAEGGKKTLPSSQSVGKNGKDFGYSPASFRTQEGQK
jgi:hypothetical protein